MGAGSFITHGLAALVGAAAASAFWISAYGDDAPVGVVAKEPPQEQAEKRVAAAEQKAPLVVGPSGLAIPVSGIKAAQLSDTYTQARSGGARVHDAIDIMAPHGTPVVAAAPGRVEKLFFSNGGGGITAYVRSDDQRWIFYYAHLQDYAAGLKEGQHLQRGDAIGRVGATGNANPDGPHLHFAVHRMRPEDDWHEGTAVNPYPLLAGNAAAR